MIKIFAVTALATIAGTVLAMAIIHALRQRYGKLPHLRVRFSGTISQSGRGPQPDLLICTWRGKLEIRNDSPTDALALKVDLIGAPHTQLTQAPSALKAGAKAELEVACSLEFNKREIHPSNYVPPGTSPMPRDIDPLRERYPDELRNLTARITCTNSSDRTCVREFKRSDTKTNEMVLQSTRRKGITQ